MAITSHEAFHLKKFIKELSNYKGRHTELITVYIPKGYEMVKIIQHLAQEQGTAVNIKSKGTRDNVITALEKMIQHLRLFKKTPENGLAVFSGNIAAKEGQQDFKVWSYEPPNPLNQRIYRCDKEFVLDALRDELEIKEAYGLVVMDRRDADFALLKGKSIIHLMKTHSEVPGKHKTGGQSAQRFERLREEATKTHFKKIAHYMTEQFLFNKDLKGILVGGPGHLKYEFVEGNFITGDLKKKIIGIKDLSYTGPFGIQELVDRSQDVLANEEIVAEKKILNRFFETLVKNPGKAAYGKEEVRKALEMGAVDILLITETIDENLIDELETTAQQYNTEVNLLSDQTREGVQLKELGGVAALLRYELH